MVVQPQYHLFTPEVIHSETPPPELFFGLLDRLELIWSQFWESLRRELLAVNFSTQEVRLSSLLADCDRYAALRDTSDLPEHERITRFMDAGDEFRRNAERGDAVALLGIGRVRDLRESLSKRDNATGRAYVFNSLKHPDEVDLLRSVWGRRFS